MGMGNVEVYYKLGYSVCMWHLWGEPHRYALMYVVNNFSGFYLVTILNEFMYYLLVSVIIANTAKLLVVTVITMM